MERLVLTTYQQTVVDDFRAAHPDDVIRPVMEGTNLVVDDHLEIDNAWSLVVLCASGGNACQVYIPDWDYQCEFAGFIDSVTGRIGPNGEIMPVVDEAQVQALLSKKTAQGGGQSNPSGRRERIEALLAKQSPETARRLRELFVQHGILPRETLWGWLIRWLKSFFS